MSSQLTGDKKNSLPKANMIPGARMPEPKNTKEKDAAAARVIWNEIAVPQGLKQAVVSLEMGYKESMLGSMLQGREAWNERAKLRYAQYFNKHPEEIWSDWPYIIERTGRTVSQQEYRIVIFYRTLSKQRREEIDRFIECKVIEQVAEAHGAGLVRESVPLSEPGKPDKP